MDFLDIFALLILAILGATFVALWVLLGMLPGMIARKRKHPQADAIAVCGWWGAVTLGILSPIAYVWAYTKTNTCGSKEGEQAVGSENSTDGGR